VQVSGSWAFTIITQLPEPAAQAEHAVVQEDDEQQ
jgi:hypothetical protein